MSLKGDKTQSESKGELAGMVNDPVEVTVDAADGANVEVTMDADHAEDLDVHVKAGKDAEVEVELKEREPDPSKRAVRHHAPAKLKWVFKPVRLGVILIGMVGVAALSGTMGLGWASVLVGVTVVGILLLISMYACIRTYYFDITQTYEKKQGVEIVSAIAGGLSEAFPAAIIAIGIGATAALLEDSHHKNQLVYEAIQWDREQIGKQLESLTSEGYGSLYNLKCAKERMVYIEASDHFDLAGFGPAMLSPLEVAQQYEEYAKSYATSKSLESIVTGIYAHFSAMPQVDAALHKDLEDDAKLAEKMADVTNLEVQNAILVRSKAIIQTVGQIEDYNFDPSAKLEKVKDLYKGLYVLTDDCAKQIGLLRDDIQRFSAEQLQRNIK